MSTRSQIGFYEEGQEDLNKFEALIYRHWDGYPEGVLPDIFPILKHFNENRGLRDIEYASAWLVRELKGGLLNVGICKAFHWDIEFFYAIYPNGEIKVYDTEFNFDNEKPNFNQRCKFLFSVNVNANNLDKVLKKYTNSQN